MLSLPAWMRGGAMSRFSPLCLLPLLSECFFPLFTQRTRGCRSLWRSSDWGSASVVLLHNELPEVCHCSKREKFPLSQKPCNLCNCENHSSKTRSLLDHRKILCGGQGFNVRFSGFLPTTKCLLKKWCPLHRADKDEKYAHTAGLGFHSKLGCCLLLSLSKALLDFLPC